MRVDRPDDLVSRIERLEELAGLRATGDTASAPALTQKDVVAAHRSFNRWLASEQRPGRVVVVGGVAKNQRLSTSLICWDNAKGAGRNWRGIAGICQALGHEARVGILRELEQGARTTAELTGAVGLDRGQLHHHLKELLLQGLVEQPARGRYAITERGERAFLLSCLLPDKADAA